jgi:hypothetical protein
LIPNHEERIAFIMNQETTTIERRTSKLFDFPTHLVAPFVRKK